ncbi:LamG-like jellyroll fold domain-containing protein [Caulobacter sp. 73W]|uniref:LamG-like jellyroll fold domain-containing protein n=1 Tax=Caulobacter sp. 73W TaxID=3161137 RepID=A0AB39KWZ1_9CAUL
MSNVTRSWRRTRLAGVALLMASTATTAYAEGLLFRASGDVGLTADQAGGDKTPNFQEKMSVVANGRLGGAMARADDGAVAWKAPGNLYAQRGTVSFFWRAREPLTDSPFVIFRAGFAAHSSFDMAFARIDWTGDGFEAFVTDANLARLRVRFKVAAPSPDAWTHIAFGWDEAVGVRLFIDGREAARLDQRADLDSGLDQFGFAGRAISPHQVHSRYNFTRGSDTDELRIYDHLLSQPEVAALSQGAQLEPKAGSARFDEVGWRHRYGWDRALPPVLSAPSTSVRKIEFADARDLKAWMLKGVDGIAETTWPGVYNRSRLPGRDDIFTLPDWNVYVEGGKRYELTVPAGERFNRLELRGAAYGAMSHVTPNGQVDLLFKRLKGGVRSLHELAPQTGGVLRFDNDAQETPIQELWAYDVKEGVAPKGAATLSYTVRPQPAALNDALLPLKQFIADRFALSERSTVVALPQGAPSAPGRSGEGAPSVAAAASEGGAFSPIVHVLVPSRFDASAAAQPVSRSWNYGWQNMHSGLDGVALDLPALNMAAGADGLIGLNIKIKDPIWPGRDMIDVSVSVRPGEPRTLWLDLRDRILTDDSLMISIASSASKFGAKDLAGLGVRLVFKDRDAAKIEHVADRFTQVKDNWAFLVEARPATVRADLYRRLYTDISDLLRVDPDHEQGRLYWQEISYAEQDWPAFDQPQAPDGVPLWAFRQLEDLKRVGQFVDWWIDERQVAYGDFGGGLSDDTDMVAQWPGLALMGYKPDKLRASLNALADAVYKNDMITGGLGTIATDELHAYEEGLNSDAAALYLNWGDPVRVERLMDTSRALRSIVTRNGAGHLHFNSNWYGGQKVWRDGPWGWQKQYSFTVMHAPILMGIYNANPQARDLVTGAVDGVLAHGKQDAAGVWSFPNEINWSTDAERVGDTGGMPVIMHAAWAAYRWTGDEKYLRPILARADKAGPGSIADLNENLIDALGRRADWGKALAARARPGDAFSQYAAWLTSGDKRWLEALHGEAIQDKSQRMYMRTQGHWWTDRVEQPSEILQRERLGGVALKRNWLYPGNTVSWRFGQEDGAVKVALLVTQASPQKFKVVAYNTSDQPQSADMTAWGVAAGRWRLSTGLDADGDDRADAPISRQVELERAASIALTFAPKAATVLEFELAEPTTPPETRADLGIGQGDVRISGGRVSFTVHSLGAQPAAGGVATLVSASGAVLGQAQIPTLDAPLDLRPRIWSGVIKTRNGASLKGARLSVTLPQAETTKLNNEVILP